MRAAWADIIVRTHSRSSSSHGTRISTAFHFFGGYAFTCPAPSAAKNAPQRGQRYFPSARISSTPWHVGHLNCTGYDTAAFGAWEICGFGGASGAGAAAAGASILRTASVA